MSVIWNILWISSVTLFQFFLSYTTQAQPSHYYIVKNKSISWKNDRSQYSEFTSGAIARIILLRNIDSGSASPRFSCGFFCESYSCESSIFAIFAIFQYYNSAQKIVWSPNGNISVGWNATLVLTGDGDLILKEYDGSSVWSTNTKGKSVAGVKLTESGNLLLFDTNNSTVWQSFDHPTDTLLLGQKLRYRQKITATGPSKNWSGGGLFSFSLTKNGFSAFIESDPSLIYSPLGFDETKTEVNQGSYAMLSNGSFAIYNFNGSEFELRDSSMESPVANSLMQHVKLEFDGHLKVYDLVGLDWGVVADLPLTSSNCSYPLACGRYGICLNENNGRVDCSCPQKTDEKNSSYFMQINERHPNLGCFEINPLSCKDSKSQKLIELDDIYHMTAKLPDKNTTDVESCKLACLNNCSCKAVKFDTIEKGCYFVSQIFTLEDSQGFVADHRFFLKVQEAPKRKRRQNLIVVGWSVGAFSGLLLIIGVYTVLLRKKKDTDDLEEDYLDQVPGMPKRYSYEDIIATTENFTKRVGQGGFGSVFEGALSDGTVVAVKRLDGFGQIKESFLSEVKTIGSIHHVNLVRLIGYCSNKSHRLLVYEYMSNGSLDKWIFRGSQNFSLDWQTRRMIIFDVAKGLAYLHDECSHKILHLDIKPQNILLNENFRAKVSDFGLSKLIDRDQSQVVTRMKGTPGYMAPEWLNSVITEKVDVYSFGVVVLEILCGRKNLDQSQDEEDMHLLSIFKRKAEQEQLLDMIDRNGEDMCSNEAEVIKMMKVAAWCLQSDFVKRPSMSIVIKVLEGLVDVEENLDYDFSFPPISRRCVPVTNNGDSNAATPILPSALSGPR